MAISNHERVGKALELLNKGLKPFIERELQAVHGEKWAEVVQASFRENRPTKGKAKALRWDTQTILVVMWDQWNLVFRNTLGQSERTLVSELREVRNKWAHQEAISTDDAYRALDSTHRLLTAVSAEEANEVDRQKQELLRVRFEEQTRKEIRKVGTTPVEGKPASGLKPWREIVTPHLDVASGRYQQAEFAADLGQVHRGEGVDEYRDPSEFFRRTFITDGLRHLLSGALERLSGKGGDPVIELQTNFGGGKTHSMLALYHLFSGVAVNELPGIEPVLELSGISQPPSAKRAVIVGTAISPGQPHRKPDGTVVKTLWGEIAWQLLGKEGFKLVAESDKQGTSPGDELREIFKRAAPCLILIDEWVAYVRQLYGRDGLSGGSFAAHQTFAQALTESAKAVPDTLVVATIPSSDIEIGGESGKVALDVLKDTFGRIETPWRPASAEESFEIVRRRLFDPITDPGRFAARDAVARAFAELYRGQGQEFPSVCREADYERRIKAAYPIHPELFDRLYKDWSSLDKFQRTRGVLRLMAAVIHTLWERQDTSLLILPAMVPIDEPTVQFELTRYLEETWVPVIESDVDGPNSLPLQLDRENPNMGRYSAVRRVARTIYLGSAPTLHTAHKGLEDLHVKLGCTQPGESVAIFGDAIRRLTDQATHLYIDGKRYWYSTQPSVTRLAQDRAAQLDEDTVREEIIRHLRTEQGHKGDFVRVHSCPAAGADVSDEKEARLVILAPEYAHAAKTSSSDALTQAKAIFDQRGSSPRQYRNTLAFLAADRSRLAELDQAVRLYLAWKSIEEDREKLNLDAFQFNLARTKRVQAEDTVTQRLPETYQWLLVPGQPSPDSPVEWQEVRLQGQDHLAVRVAKKMKNEEMLIIQFAGTRLRLELDRVPLWRGDHVTLKQLAEDFAQYLYLPRLRVSDVLVEAAREGVGLLTWEKDTFAYADGWDATGKRYQGLRGGQVGVRVSLEGGGLVVKPDVAARQLQEDTGKRPDGDGDEKRKKVDEKKPKEHRPRRFYGSVQLDATRLGRDAGKIAEEVVQHLSGIVGAEVEVTLEIHAKVDAGVPDNVIRTVTENCKTLRFESHEFEES